MESCFFDWFLQFIFLNDWFLQLTLSTRDVFVNKEAKRLRPGNGEGNYSGGNVS